MARFFTSDLHISHRLVSGLRKFQMRDQDKVVVPDTFAHDVALADNWDAVVQPEDEVWILGDMSINSGPQVVEWVTARPGIKHLVSGNHDKTHTGIFPSKSNYVRHLWKDAFASIQDEAIIEIAGRKVTLSHFPFWSWGDGPSVRANAGPNFQPRYPEFRPVEKPDVILLHGHTHSTERGHERSYHVGLDAHDLQLVPEQTIIEWIKTL